MTDSKSNANSQARTQPYYGTGYGAGPAGYGAGMPGYGAAAGTPGYGTAAMPGYGAAGAAGYGFPGYGAQPATPQTAVSGGPFFQAPTQTPVPGMLPLEESYIENILRLNKGKLATVYMSFENGQGAKVFKGIIEAAGRDHLILSDPQTGMRYLLLMIYLNYVTFDEEIEYDYPFGAAPGMAQYTPR